MAEPSSGADAPVADTFALPETSARARALQEEKLREFELKRKVRQTVVPTDDGKVRQMLRALGEPVTLFGEKEMERRERLRRLLADKDADEVGAQLADFTGVPAVIEAQTPLATELFFTEGPETLQQARKTIAEWSLRRAARRLQAAKELRSNPGAVQEEKLAAAGALASMRHVAQQCSEIGGERPLACCAFSPNGEVFATAGWGGTLATWSVPDCKQLHSSRAHEERCTGLAWHPQATTSQTPEALHLATGSADGTARLFDAAGKLLRTLSGHTGRLGKVAFHPMGQHLATASFDMTWRLWDVETGATLIEQEGHSREVYAVAFHPDGSLAASAGLDAVGRIWDCRTGRSVLTLQGHVKQVLALDFAPNGCHLLSGGEDNSCRVWDLRKKHCLSILPAHRKKVTTCRFAPGHGHYFITAGFDNVAKVWSGKDFSLVKTLSGHENYVMCADVRPGEGIFFGTTSYDRTIKFWCPETVPDVLAMMDEDEPRQAWDRPLRSSGGAADMEL